MEDVIQLFVLNLTTLEREKKTCGVLTAVKVEQGGGKQRKKIKKRSPLRLLSYPRG